MTYYNNTELYHHGIKGQKWGVRRFENEDGTLTELGKKRYKYGTVTVSRNRLDDTDSYVVSKGNKAVEISRRSLRAVEQVGEQNAQGIMEQMSGMTVKQLRSMASNKEEHKVLDNFLRDTMDTIMEKTLSDLIDASGNKSTYYTHYGK
jgi:hypothetical protein